MRIALTDDDLFTLVAETRFDGDPDTLAAMAGSMGVGYSPDYYRGLAAAFSMAAVDCDLVSREQTDDAARFPCWKAAVLYSCLSVVAARLCIEAMHEEEFERTISVLYARPAARGRTTH